MTLLDLVSSWLHFLIRDFKRDLVSRFNGTSGALFSELTLKRDLSALYFITL